MYWTINHNAETDIITITFTKDHWRTLRLRRFDNTPDAEEFIDLLVERGHVEYDRRLMLV